MNQVVLSLSQAYIKEDLEYYFSGERDKNNQIRPDEKIYSMTPWESHVDIDFQDGKVGNFFYPLTPNCLERIYIGISISLYANHWGASFLLELLKVLKPDGAVILPVYPEGQAAEKGYWSRSFLENIFLSRTRWRGMSNINAENDGVMSLRVGRKWPERMPSSIEWFYQERSNLLLNNLLKADQKGDLSTLVKNQFQSLCSLVWNEYSTSASIEKIIDDYYGREAKIDVEHVGHDYGLLLNDLMHSPYVNVTNGMSLHLGICEQNIMRSVTHYFAPLTVKPHSVKQVDNVKDFMPELAQVIILNNVLSESSQEDFQNVLEQAWSRLPASGILVVYEDLSEKDLTAEALDQLLNPLGTISYYSSIVASKIQSNTEISQYSLAVEEDLRQENISKQSVYRVIQKS